LYQSHKSWRGYKSLISNTIEPPINYAYYKYFHFFVFIRSLSCYPLQSFLPNAGSKDFHCYQAVSFWEHFS
jgi:hypothetical protein